MTLHPTYLAAFRGGSPSHPMHPNSKAWHEQYVAEVVMHDIHREGRLREGGERVLSLVGSHFWYRPGDFANVIKDARDERFRVLAASLPVRDPHGL